MRLALRMAGQTVLFCHRDALMAEPKYDFQLPEYPDATRARLEAVGPAVWKEADLLRRKVFNRLVHRARLKHGAGGLPVEVRAECHKRAWDSVYEKWPPPADAEPLASLVNYLNTHDGNLINKGGLKRLPKLTADQELRFDSIGETDDHAAEVIWVYNNLDKKEVDAGDCPSRGAWSLLGEAKKNRPWFYDKMYRPIAQQLSKQQAAVEDSEYKPSKAEKLACAELDEMIREAVEAANA